MPDQFADKMAMQHRLFSELSRMFGEEVPLYDKALLVNRECNKTVCALLARRYTGFSLSDAQLDKASGERHGAIRIGTPAEYNLVTRFFACFAMEPHNFYDMSNVGGKSQPIIATAFRSDHSPEHRVFTSLLQTDYFDPQTRHRIESLLATRDVFSAKAKELIEKVERQGGLSWPDADALIREGFEHIFKWTGRARDHQLYLDLCASGFKIAADIACFESHHLNHLTPNTFWMDLYTAAMNYALREIDEPAFRSRASRALKQLSVASDRHYMRLNFKHLSFETIDGFNSAPVDANTMGEILEQLTARLNEPDLNLDTLDHSGFKDTTEGPSEDTPVLLRQDSYKALTEDVLFTNADGSTMHTVHTARFGEIEQRFFATTKAGRTLYDECLARAEVEKEKDPELPSRDFEAYQTMYARCFAPFPKTLPALLAAGLAYGLYSSTPKGQAARATIATTNITELVRLGYVDFDGQRYEDFLPVSAAGIFASNLNQYGTKSTAAKKPVYTQAMLEEIMGREIIDADEVYAGIEAQSLLDTYASLGLIDTLPPNRHSSLQLAACGPKPRLAAPR